MAELSEIVLGIPSGAFLTYCLFGGLAYCDRSTYRHSIENPHHIEGRVIEDNYSSSYGHEEYNVSIQTLEGEKFAVHYSDRVSSTPCSVLSVLFTPGDFVELHVGTYEDYTGKQKLLGIDGKLLDP